MPIRWKVIRFDKNGDRVSVFAPGAYKMSYPKGSIVEAEKGTLGLMVFHRKMDAEAFIDNFCCHSLIAEPIKVEGLGKGKKPKAILRHCGIDKESELDAFYRGIPMELNPQTLIRTTQAPEGTLCYDKIRVLE